MIPAAQPAGEGRGTEIPSPAGQVVCVVGRCKQPPVEESGVLCQRHYDIVGQLVPDRLEKKPGHGTLVCDRLTADELAAIAAQVERDAFPLFLVAWNWCGLQAIGKVAGRNR